MEYMALLGSAAKAANFANMRWESWAGVAIIGATVVLGSASCLEIGSCRHGTGVQRVRNWVSPI